MPLSEAAATNNANSKVLRIGRVVEQRSMASIEQMRQIAAIVDEWRDGMAGTRYATTPGAGGRPRTGGTRSCDGPPHPVRPVVVSRVRAGEPMMRRMGDALGKTLDTAAVTLVAFVAGGFAVVAIFGFGADPAQRVFAALMAPTFALLTYALAKWPAPAEVKRVEAVANIETPRQACLRGCKWTGPWGSRRGDVRRCPHGRIWRYRARYVDGCLWARITPFWEPIDYRRAVRALAAEEDR